MWTLLAGSIVVAGGPPVAVHPIAARHHGRHEGPALVWETLAVFDAGTSLGGTVRLPLATPLPPGASVKSEAAIDLVRDARDRVIALDVAGSWGPERHVRDRWTRGLALTVRLPVEDRDRVAMRVPLFAGNAVQRISMAGMDNLMFEPDPTIGIERHVRHFVGQEVTRSMRRDSERLLREHGARGADGLAIFVVANGQVAGAESLGEIVSRESHRQLVATGAIAGCGVLALLMLVAYRRLSRTAQLERSLAQIDRDLADLGEVSQRPRLPEISSERTR